MRPKLVYCILPIKNDLLIKTKALAVPNHNKTIYDATGFFEDEFFKNIGFKYASVNEKDYVGLRDIINLHDEEGLKLYKIKRMVSRLNFGSHIMNETGLPNIKLVRTKDNKYLVYDGHHTLLSYLLLGKRYLFEIPYIFVESEVGYFDDEDISIFFLRHKNKIKKDDWRKYVANWNQPIDKQITLRKRKNIGELFDAIRSSISPKK